METVFREQKIRLSALQRFFWSKKVVAASYNVFLEAKLPLLEVATSFWSKTAVAASYNGSFGARRLLLRVTTASWKQNFRCWKLERLFWSKKTVVRRWNDKNGSFWTPAGRRGAKRGFLARRTASGSKNEGKRMGRPLRMDEGWHLDDLRLH
ncbi:MAG: hypothetical protein NT105_06105 [Verrucomicrobia bacterium]|nr:hypothetical protein [Verrucomicrobiota bacterium]